MPFCSLPLSQCSLLCNRTTHMHANLKLTKAQVFVGTTSLELVLKAMQAFISTTNNSMAVPRDSTSVLLCAGCALPVQPSDVLPRSTTHWTKMLLLERSLPTRSSLSPHSTKYPLQTSAKCMRLNANLELALHTAHAKGHGKRL